MSVCRTLIHPTLDNIFTKWVAMAPFWTWGRKKKLKQKGLEHPKIKFSTQNQVLREVFSAKWLGPGPWTVGPMGPRRYTGKFHINRLKGGLYVS